jgi:polysaccharide export outer membrane protein
MNLAQLDSILVFRTVNGQRMAAKFDLNLIRSGDAADPQIFGDDIIVVGVSNRKWAYRKFLESIPLVNAFILY